MISRKATQLQIREQENHNNGKIDSMIEDAFERYLTSGVDVNRNRRKYEIFSLESVRRDILGIARVPSESGYQGQDKAHVTRHVSALVTWIISQVHVCLEDYPGDGILSSPSQQLHF